MVSLLSAFFAKVVGEMAVILLLMMMDPLVGCHCSWLAGIGSGGSANGRAKT